ncbi:hypothetical protein BDZ97DRAFT_1661641 [Flammula alnicola]|nr:hypothetical protein BDZ97DRAFT_1661641 [Flammula alnicola]
MSIAESDARKVDHGDNTILMTTVPSQVLGKADDPDGYSEWVVFGPTKRKVLNSPGYPQPVPKPVGGTSIEVKATPNMGMGVFATRDIKLGELIFAERPLLVTPRGVYGLGGNIPPEYTMDQYQTVVMLEWEKTLEVSVSRMEPENQEAFKALMNNHKEDGSGPLLGIIRTNGYGVDNLFDGDVASEAHFYSAIGKVGSRINHSCMPNIRQSFKLNSFSLQFTATKDIKAGEQVFYSYASVFQGVAARRRELAPYGVICECPACVNATPETDKFREEMRLRINKYDRDGRTWIGGKVPTRKDLEEMLQFQEAVIKEGLQSQQIYALLFAVIQTAYWKLGMNDKALEYLDQMEKYQKFWKYKE